MLKNVSKLGTPLTKKEQLILTGGKGCCKQNGVCTSCGSHCAEPECRIFDCN